jgi:hypothetical protein
VLVLDGINYDELLLETSFKTNNLILLPFNKGSLMKLYRFIFVIFGFITYITGSQAAPLTAYLPSEQVYKSDIPTPESVLGFGIGERHLRHGQMFDYMNKLTQSSERVLMTDMGKTNQFRQQVLLTISSPENLKNIDSILNNRSRSSSQKPDEPLVVWLGYSVHGDEISGTNAAMLVAYHFAASQDKNIEAMLQNTIIVMEPSINPDGMDRFVNWVTTHKGQVENPDPNHIEHHQNWRTGRTNHFSFDLNRDWLLLSQKESQNRLPFFHRYQPNVLGDFHEMGANSSYFFQPGIPTRTHPLTPAKNTELTQLLATYHAKALDQEDRLYFSEENFDDFYYGKGSTYPDINGGIGILFEQASSRGMQQNTINGLLTFEYGIKNHVLTSLSTVNGAWNNQATLKKYRKEFYNESLKQAKKEDFSGYLISEKDDSYRLNTFLSKLKQHQINVYPITEDFRHNSKVFSKDHTFYVPLEQPQYRVIKALFNQDTDFQDNTFYDVSGWTMPLAMNIEFHQVERTWGLSLAKTTWQMPSKVIESIDENAYAYAFDWHHFLAPKLLNTLLNDKIKARVATKPFTTEIAGQKRQFKTGSIVIPAGIQTKSNWRKLLLKASQESNISIASLTTGFTSQGIDLGSRSLEAIKPVKALLMGGKGISQYEAGEILYYLDETLRIPVSVIEHQRINSIDLSTYTHIILVDGNYENIPSKTSIKLEAWAKQGGVLFGQKRGAKWLAKQDILKTEFATKNQINQLFDTDGLQYQDKESLAGRKRIAGAIFNTIIDTSHPLAYGYSNNTLPLFRNSTLIMEQPSQAFITVAKYTPLPLLSGYTDRNLVNRIANNAAIVGHNVKKGRVVATSDNLVFRGYWHGSAKLLANTLFFAKAFDTPIEE